MSSSKIGTWTGGEIYILPIRVEMVPKEEHAPCRRFWPRVARGPWEPVGVSQIPVETRTDKENRRMKLVEALGERSGLIPPSPCIPDSHLNGPDPLLEWPRPPV